MFKLRHIFRPVNVDEERDFERINVQQKLDRYLKTNPLSRYENDAAYRTKVDLTEISLKSLPGFILDIGGNTAGEATILKQRGYNMVVSDINETALDISRQRVEKFGLLKPHYVAADAHNLPFKDAVFDAVTVLEALHHFVEYDRVLSEIHRVLKPGGHFFTLEPNAINPIRRASELRDRLRGTIEKSFYAKDLENMCHAAGFVNITVKAVPTGKSSWKLEEVPAYRKGAARLHGWLNEKFPVIFGPLTARATKAGTLDSSKLTQFNELLRSPINGSDLVFSETTRRWNEKDGPNSFPSLNGIPVLISQDATQG